MTPVPVGGLVRVATAVFGERRALVIGVCIALLIAAAAAVGVVAGPSLGVLVLASAALIAAIAALWGSLRALVGDTPLSPEDAFALGAPSAEEEQKRAVLRAIKDIEFERAVGKISDEDYRALHARYRAEAKRLLRTIDERAAPDRARAERLLAARFDGEPNPLGEPRKKKKKKKKPFKADSAQTRAVSAVTNPYAPATFGADAKIACGQCGANNDADAAFCKACGKPMGAVEAS